MMAEPLTRGESNALYKLSVWADEHGRDQLIHPHGVHKRTLATLAKRGYVEIEERPGLTTLARITDAGQRYITS